MIVGADWTFHPWRHNNVGDVTAVQARHNSNNVGGVTAGKMGHNSSIANNDVTADSASSRGRDIVKHHRISTAGEN